MAKSNVVHLVPLGGGVVANEQGANGNGHLSDVIVRCRAVIELAAEAQRALDRTHSRDREQRERLTARAWFEGWAEVSGDTRETVEALRAELRQHPALFPNSVAYAHSASRMVIDYHWRGPGADVPLTPEMSYPLVIGELSRVGASVFTLLLVVIGDLEKSHPQAFGKLARGEQSRLVEGLRRNRDAALAEVTRLPEELLVGIAHVSGVPIDPTATLPQRLVEHATAGWPKAVAVESGTRHFTAGAAFLNQ
jgi:hypothetical protein